VARSARFSIDVYSRGWRKILAPLEGQSLVSVTDARIFNTFSSAWKAWYFADVAKTLEPQNFFDILL
jgi:hypothetical protein